MTTWADLREGDVVLDKNGDQWTVRSTPEPSERGGVSVGITDGTRYLSLIQDPDAEAPTLGIPREVITELGPTVIATETAAESITRNGSGPKVYPAVADMGILKIRSHLYLVHANPQSSDLTELLDMFKLHTRLHKQPMETEHEHLSDLGA